MTIELANTNITTLKKIGDAIVLTELLLSFFLLHKLPLQQSKLSGLKCWKLAKFKREMFLVFLNNWHVLLEIQPRT